MATKTTIKRTARKTTKATARKSRKAATILGLPIEGADHKAPRTEIADYIDSEGMELPEPQEGLSEKKQAEKDRKFVAKQKAKQEREAAKTYHGPAIPGATRVFKAQMTAFKNCRAFCWMILREGENLVTYANTYGQEGDGVLKASYDQSHYTHPIKSKIVAAKMESMVEVEDPTEWPTWITSGKAPVPAKRTRKAK